MAKALGRGLDALLQPAAVNAPAGDAVAKLPIDKIRPNRYQPRLHFGQDALQELSESIREHGIAQPLLVTASPVPGEYELVAGERRLRAAKLAGLKEIPCVIRAMSERERSELSLIENIQREDLNAIEEADALHKLMEQFSLTQDDLAKTLGRSRSAIANKLRLLELPEDLRAAVMEGQMSEGHARTLLGIAEPARQRELGRRILDEKLTVRDVEKIVTDWQSAVREGRVRKEKHKDPDAKNLEEDLQRVLGRRVEIQAQGQKGWLRISFYSLDDLQVLVDQLKVKKDAVAG